MVHEIEKEFQPKGDEHKARCHEYNCENVVESGRICACYEQLGSNSQDYQTDDHHNNVAEEIIVEYFHVSD